MVKNNFVVEQFPEKQIAEKITDLLIAETNITDYADSYKEINVSVDFEYSLIDVNVADKFTISYYPSDNPMVKFQSDYECDSEVLADIIVMLGMNSELWEIFDLIKPSKFYKVVAHLSDGDVEIKINGCKYFTSYELAEQIKADHQTICDEIEIIEYDNR